MRLLLGAGGDANLLDHNRCAPLQLAAIYGKDDVVQLLLAAGADPNHANKEGVTALHDVVTWGRFETAALLLRYGAKIHIKDSHHRTALDLAQLGGDPKIICLLQAASAVAVALGVA